jgi:hypothetical protein
MRFQSYMSFMGWRSWYKTRGERQDPPRGVSLDPDGELSETLGKVNYHMPMG